MVFCCICGVHLRHQSDGIRFHRLPKNTIKRKQWLAVIEEKIKQFSYTENSVICSQHFAKECYVITGCGKFYLKSGTIPTIFDMPLRNGCNNIKMEQQLQQQYICDTDEGITEKSYKKSINEQCPEFVEQVLLGTNMQPDAKNTMNIEETHESTPKVQRITKFGSIDSTNLDICNSYKDPLYHLKIKEKEIKRLKSKLKLYQQKCRRLNKKVLSLRSLVKHLENKKLSEDY